jgi:hypothetical protein
MVRRPAVLARVVALETALLAAIALEHRRVQIQHIARMTRKPRTRVFRQHRRQLLDLAAHETPEVTCQRHRRGQPLRTDELFDDLVLAQPLHVREAPPTAQHRREQRQRHRHHRDLVRRRPPIR